MPDSNPKRIVIIDWSMIGDLIMLSPAIRSIAEHYADSHIALLGQPSSIEIYKNSPYVHELLPYDRSSGDYDLGSFRKTVAMLRQRRFDLGFVFHNSIGSALMAWFGRVKQRVGYRHELRDILLTKRFKLPERRQHLIETKADLLRSYGIEVEDLSEIVSIDQAAAKRWLREMLGPNLGRNRPIIAVCLGATKEYKRWHAKGLNALLNQFPVNSCDVVFLGSPKERELYEGVYSYNNTVVDLVGQTTIEELTWVLDRVDLLVTPDSGPMHLAIGRNTPVVALFGPTDPARCGPYQYERSQVIRAERICPSCDARFGKHIRQCLHTIDPEEVYCACVGLLAQYSKRWSMKNA